MNKNHKLTDEITEMLREVFETSEKNMIVKKNLFLVRGGKNISGFIKEVREDGERIQTYLNGIVKRSSELGGFKPEKILKNTEVGTKMLIESTIKSALSAQAKVSRLQRVIPLKEAIFQQTQRGINEGIAIVYRNKRSFGYKDYMEMNVRTTIQHEIGEQQLDSGVNARIVFYLCNVYADCADDHKDFQGLMYFDERWEGYNLKDEIKTEIRKLIHSKNMMSVQRVRSDEPYLTTRPNCRHVLVPISIDQALGLSVDKLLNDLQLKRGSYRPKNYEQSQQQRYNERQIRFYKSRKEINEELLSKDPDNEFFKKQIEKDKGIVRAWQKKQRELVASNPVLSRDYRRETRNVLLNDLGAKYNTPKN